MSLGTIHDHRSSDVRVAYGWVEMALSEVGYGSVLRFHSMISAVNHQCMQISADC